MNKTTSTTEELQIPQTSIDNPQDLVNFANILKKVVVERQLFSNIKGKNYVNVEGWQFAGLAMGIVPVVVQVQPVESADEIKYRADVKLIRVSDQTTVGSGVGVCSSKEKSERRDEYAIAAMAQTRAISRAYRNSFGWLMKATGYESTPAEEMQDVFVDTSVKAKAEEELEQL